MLLRCFGLKDDPFGVTPEPRFLYQSETHREALAGLKCGFYGNRGFTSLIASPGLGKTTLLQCFLSDIQDTARSAYLFNIDGQTQPWELIASILRDLGMSPLDSASDMREQLNAALAQEARSGRLVVVVVDEAQNLSDAALESLRLLSNFETASQKLMHIILAGQPQLSERLQSPGLTQLRQRITTVCRLKPLSADETKAYVEHRLSVAGYAGDPLFTEGAIALIAAASQGIPRTINTLCFNALLICRALNKKQVDGLMVEEAIGDLQLSPGCDVPALSVPLPLVHDSAPDRFPAQFPEARKRWVPAIAATVIVFLGTLGLLGSRWIRSSHKSVEASSGESQSLPPSATGRDKSAPASLKPAVLTHGPVKVTVAAHQTLCDIAVKFFGVCNQSRLQQIRKLNPMLRNPNHIVPGQSVWLPGPPPAMLTDSAVHSN
jgi:type II secretory pathway predicted ATPase ExeA